jgi:hypothetical protein
MQQSVERFCNSSRAGFCWAGRSAVGTVSDALWKLCSLIQRRSSKQSHDSFVFPNPLLKGRAYRANYCHPIPTMANGCLSHRTPSPSRLELLINLRVGDSERRWNQSNWIRAPDLCAGSCAFSLRKHFLQSFPCGSTSMIVSSERLGVSREQRERHFTLPLCSYNHRSLIDVP